MWETPVGETWSGDVECQVQKRNDNEQWKQVKVKILVTFESSTINCQSLGILTKKSAMASSIGNKRWSFDKSGIE